jgi:hypothetical protein
MILYILIAFVLISTLWARLGSYIRNYMIKQTLGLHEYAEIGHARADGKIKGTPVIAGGRYTPLCAYWSATFDVYDFPLCVVSAASGQRVLRRSTLRMWSSSSRRVGHWRKRERLLSVMTTQGIRPMPLSRNAAESSNTELCMASPPSCLSSHSLSTSLTFSMDRIPRLYSLRPNESLRELQRRSS